MFNFLSYFNSSYFLFLTSPKPLFSWENLNILAYHKSFITLENGHSAVRCLHGGWSQMSWWSSPPTGLVHFCFEEFLSFLAVVSEVLVFFIFATFLLCTRFVSFMFLLLFSVIADLIFYSVLLLHLFLCCGVCIIQVFAAHLHLSATVIFYLLHQYAVVH